MGSVLSEVRYDFEWLGVVEETLKKVSGGLCDMRSELLGSKGMEGMM